jgi:DNA-binding NarL/FixJ family response regulator
MKDASRIMPKVITVLVVDDHAVTRNGIINILGEDANLKVIGEAKDGQDAIDQALDLKPDIVLMDIFMPHCNGIEATAVLSQKLPSVKVLMITVSERGDDLLEALKMGARGYVVKSASPLEIVQAVKKTAAGEPFLSPEMASKLVSELRVSANKSKISLSARESEVLELASQGLTDRQIAFKLSIGESTVRTYFERSLEKLHLKNRAEAIAYVARHERRSR